MAFDEGFVRIVSDGITRKMKVINPATGEELEGVCGITIETLDANGKFLPFPVATIKLYARAEVLASLKTLPQEWPIEDAKNGVLP